MEPTPNSRTSKTFEVMAPMNVKLYNKNKLLAKEDWSQFDRWLKELKNIGIDAISVSIFWGMVESEGDALFEDKEGEILFDWAYFDRVLELILKNKLNWSPSFSLHMAGDLAENYLQHIPDWIWGKLLLENDKIKKISDLKYVSETGEKSFEYLSLWADDYVLPYYEDFFKAFLKHYEDYAEYTAKLMLSMGPSGELRYPSFNLHDWGGYPNRGTLQCYSKPAKDDFMKFLLKKYIDLKGINHAWGTAFAELKEVGPPTAENDIFQGKKYITTPYGRDVSEWYNQALLQHGNRMLRSLDNMTKGTAFEETKLGFRLSGVHWNISNPDMPRVSEVTSGIIKSHENMDYTDHGEYKESLAQIVDEDLRKKTVLHFTCVEKVNKDEKGYSRAEDLTRWLGDAANDLGIEIIAENAMYGGLYSHQGWDQLEKALHRNKPYNGLNIRSIRHILQGNELGYFRLKNLLLAGKSEAPKPILQKKTFRVMGPLHVKVSNDSQLLEEVDWFDFDAHLKAIKKIGVTAVTIDVWWGIVAREGEGLYDWSYYDKVVRMIRSNGLNWGPIMSFHQAGGNVNDDYNQMIPVWLWGKLMAFNKINKISDLQYVSETGDASIEYVSLWADEFILPHYVAFMEAFKKHYADYASVTEEVNISLGPAGELRYPSFNGHDWGSYPNRGTLQCYSDLAKADLREFVKERYGTLEKINKAWGTDYEDFGEINPPDNQKNDIFSGKGYFQAEYGLDVMEWYHNSLMMHGRRVMKAAYKVFSEGAFANVELGFKIPGVHWKISDPNMPRVAEVTAGLICPHQDLNMSDQGEYVAMLKKILNHDLQSKLTLHFTCLEKFNRDYEGYSRAEDLVNWMADACHEVGLDVKGENATAWEISSKEAWDQMEKALTREHPYSGLTILRMQNLVEGNDFALNCFRLLIQKINNLPV
ncbi:family 14 glycosylhydrolase [Flammeovirgaceae bacterium SG7u.111]|nr:family 14 glycosylhydrolase [Flammeovirgaceae bacterium SG7u.132]WPO34074.1 family 14 glycosylhydrolase [Flammeovirgaceae bacterium SG7u.111]